MVQYYNLTKFGDQEGFMGFMTTMNTLTGGDLFVITMVILIFLVPLIYQIKAGNDLIKSLHYSSLWSTLLILVLYVAQVTTNTQLLYLSALVYVVTASIRWYHKD